MPAKKSNKTVKSVTTKKVQSSKGQALAKMSARQRPGLRKANAPKLTEKPKPRNSLTVDVFNITGKKEGTLSLPKEIFGVSPNQKLLSQALHIYFVNQSAHYASTKTRSEVRGGGAKPWKQKGTGRARAGSRRSPLWVGGAKALAPKPRKVLLSLPKKMRKRALIAALSTKAKSANVKVVSNIEKIEPKTKIIASFLKKIETQGTSLFIISKKTQNVSLALRNIRQVSLDTAQNLNTLEITKNRNIFFSKEALDILPQRFLQKGEGK